MANGLSPILRTAKEILESAGLNGMSVQDIAQAAVEQNKNMGLSAEVFCKKVTAALRGNVKLKIGETTFSRVNWDKGPRKGKPKQGWYRLKQKKVTPVIQTVQMPKINKCFLGKAGEHAVLSELLFWEYNASIMTVDDGVDIVASKQGKFFHIQVKTATQQGNGKFFFSISQSAFNKHHDTNVYYVLVLRQGIKNEFIILPSTHVEYALNMGVIAGQSSLSLTVTTDAKSTQYFLNGKHDITPFYGKFGEIIK